MSNMKTAKADSIPLLIGTSICEDYDRINKKKPHKTKQKNPQIPKTFVVPVKSLPLETTQGLVSLVSNAALTQSQQQKTTDVVH